MPRLPAGGQLMGERAPFPYFGGKSRVAAEVWARFGDVPNFVEPFFGSGAVLLARPDAHDWPRRVETVNDIDGFISNFWRSVRADPDAVAHHADWPVSECDMHARHAWLVGRREDITRRLEGDPAWYDARVAGWWVWGLCCWIGSGWCIDDGPWRVVEGELLRVGGGVRRKLPHLGDAGRGVHRKRPHLGAGRGVNRQLPHLGDAGQGVNRQLPHLGDGGQGVAEAWSVHLRETMARLADRLRRVRVCCGDWSRVLGETPTVGLGTTAVFLDPPYSLAERTADLYAADEDGDVAAAVRDWAVARGDDPRYRIALCGYGGEHDMPDGWTAHAWKAKGGYGSQGDGRGRANAARETVWFSPHCLGGRGDAAAGPLFARVAD